MEVSIELDTCEKHDMAGISCDMSSAQFPAAFFRCPTFDHYIVASAGAQSSVDLLRKVSAIGLTV
jgi:hypothetical protein